MENAIEVINLSKIYTIYDNSILRLKDALGFSKANHGREFYALNDIDFSVKKGKTLGIIGENGAGKSTLLKIITGVLSPSKGKIILNGRVSALLELGTGFNPEYTGIENIYLSGNIMGLDRDAVDKKVQDILDFADIGDFINQKVKTYSSGMFARLAFAVAINVEPEILIVDEALAVGDLFFQQKCNVYMKEKMAGCTKLLVTHDMSSIANMADEAMVISKGRQVYYGDPLGAIEFYTQKTHTDLFQKNHSEFVSGNSGENGLVLDSSNLSEDWIKVEEDKLGGAMEAIVQAFRIRVNGEAYRGFICDDDEIEISLVFQAARNMNNILIGYQIKDKYGNTIFGENSHSSGFQESKIAGGKKYMASLTFNWPRIQENNYFLTLGIGEGTHEMQHVIQCWAHSIFEFKTISKLPDHGLFNQPIIKYAIKEVK